MSDCAAHDKRVEDRLCMGYAPAPGPVWTGKSKVQELDEALDRINASSLPSSSPREQR